MKKFVIQIVVLIAILLGALYVFAANPKVSNLPFVPEQPVVKQLQINDATVNVEIADTQAKRSKGLGGRGGLGQNEGMLFIFDKADKHPFWMKGLSFPLDFVWIKGDKVVDVSQNVSPPSLGQKDDSLPIYQPKGDVDKVLELNAASIQRLNIKIGDTIKVI